MCDRSVPYVVECFAFVEECCIKCIVIELTYENGRLYFLWWPDRWVLDPISETEFIANPRGFRLTINTDDDGVVTGFDMFGAEWVGLD